MSNEENKPPKLKVRERKFVRAYVKHGKASQAVVEAGYSSKSRQAINVAASRLLQRDRVQSAIQFELEKNDPDLAATMRSKLSEIVRMPIKQRLQDEGISVADYLKAVETISKLMGWEQPRKNLNINARVNALPTE